MRDREFPWNLGFGGKTVVVEDEGELPRIELDGGMVLTVLSPSWTKLGEMRDRWIDDLEGPAGSGIEPGDWEKALEVLGTHRPSLPDVLSAEEIEWPPDVDRLPGCRRDRSADRAVEGSFTVIFYCRHCSRFDDHLRIAIHDVGGGDVESLRSWRDRLEVEK